MVGLSVADTSGKAIANLGFERVVFERRVFAGDTLYAESEVLDKRQSSSKSDRGVIHIETRAFNQNRRARALATADVSSTTRPYHWTLIARAFSLWGLE